MESLKLTRAAELAAQILNISRNTLVVNMRFLDAALFRLRPEQAPITLATDGERMYYDPFHILEKYKSDKNAVTRDCLHVLLHCVFRHPFVDPATVDRELWNIACDIAVESLISSFTLSCTEVARTQAQTDALKHLQPAVKSLTAEKIYRYLLDEKFAGRSVNINSAAFYSDDHSVWYNQNKPDPVAVSSDNNNSNNSNDSNGDNNSNDNGDNDSNDDGNSAENSRQIRQRLSDEWKEISERIQTDMETASRIQGDRAGGMQQQLRELNRERYDYRSFLKKFAVMGEAMKINDDEFDYIFYTYGLKLFGNMPLIEPLEYKEVKRIRDFVIAIDTSGSTSGELVQKFLQKTFNILKSEESFFAKMNLYVIQCDADIQEVAKITTQEEFDEYIKGFTVKGLGGTDFRPVFEYVDRLVEGKAFTNLKGLIYFTDGCGTFPAKKPDYQTAFVFVQSDWNNPDIPPWAIKLVLEAEEI